MDAEDVVQEAFVRWRRAPEAEVRSPRAYLSAGVTGYTEVGGGSSPSRA